MLFSMLLLVFVFWGAKELRMLFVQGHIKGLKASDRIIEWSGMEGTLKII